VQVVDVQLLSHRFYIVCMKERPRGQGWARQSGSSGSV
jgi:hypothetical protein